MFRIKLPYNTESAVKRAEWVIDELYCGNDSVRVTVNYPIGDIVTIECANDTRQTTRHFEGL